MKVAVRFFARYREAAGRDHIELEVPEGGTVEAAWEAVASRFPVLQPYRPFTLFALGTDYVQPNHPLRPGDEVCLFPPVSGGTAGQWARDMTSLHPPFNFAEAERHRMAGGGLPSIPVCAPTTRGAAG